MGGSTTFRLSSRPPEPADYAHLFPDAQPGSFVMQYEVRRTPQGLQPYFEEGNEIRYTIPEMTETAGFDGMDLDHSGGSLQMDFDSIMDDKLHRLG